MQIIYAAPFILLSMVGAFLCFIMPKLRKYSLQVAAAPLAFGFCSITGMLAVSLLNDYSGLHYAVLDEPIIGARGFALMAAIYLLPGVLGAGLAIWIVGRISAILMGRL